MAAGGTPFLVHTLLKHGYLHDDVLTVSGRGLWRHTREARLDGDQVTWEEGPKSSLDTDVLRAADQPFAPDGGRLLAVQDRVPVLFDLRDGRPTYPEAKRVAAAVGEGSMAVALAHRRLDEMGAG